MKVYQFEAIGDVSVKAFGDYSLTTGMFITDRQLQKGDIVTGEFMKAWIDGNHPCDHEEITFAYLLEEQDTILNQAAMMFRDREFDPNDDQGGNDGWSDLYAYRPNRSYDKDCYIRIL